MMSDARARGCRADAIARRRSAIEALAIGDGVRPRQLTDRDQASCRAVRPGASRTNAAASSSDAGEAVIAPTPETAPRA